MSPDELIDDPEKVADKPANPPDAATTGPVPAARIERRRPGRPDHASPELIPLLRGIEPALPPELPGILQDHLSSMRGIALALLISALLWTAILWLVF